MSPAENSRESAAKRRQVLFDGRGHGNGERPGMAGKDDPSHQPALAQKKRAPKKPRREWRAERAGLGLRTAAASSMIIGAASDHREDGLENHWCHGLDGCIFCACFFAGMTEARVYETA